MTITEDLLLGAKFTLDLAGGVLTRVFEVNGLVPGRDTLAQAAFGQDSATGSRIPAYGDAHPGVAGLFVSSVEADPLPGNPTAAQVKVRYSSPELSSVPNVAKIAIAGSNRVKQISKDPAGAAPLLVRYTDSAGSVLQEYLQVPVLSPNTLLTFTRQEFKSPLTTSIRFRRTVNASPWQSGAARTWLCRAIDAASLGNVARYEVKYVFEYDPDGWERLEYYRDPHTGKVPTDVAESTNNDRGVARILPYGVAEFSQLNLPNAF
jgi:hypothetical protein